MQNDMKTRKDQAIARLIIERGGEREREGDVVADWG